MPRRQVIGPVIIAVLILGTAVAAGSSVQPQTAAPVQEHGDALQNPSTARLSHSGEPGASIVQQPQADYTIKSVSKLVYRDQKGFKDTNGDGKVVVEIGGKIDYSTTQRDGVVYNGDAPLVVYGTSNAVVTNSTGGGIATKTASLTVTNLNFTHIGGVPIKSGGNLRVENVYITRSAGGIQTAPPAGSGPASARIHNVHVTHTKWGVNVNGDLTLTDSSFVSLNDYGAAVNGNATVRNTAFKHITGSHRGGALDVSGTVHVTGSTFKDLRALLGGAIRAGGKTVVKDSTFTNLRVSNEGGAILANGKVVIVNSQMRQVTANGDAAGIAIRATGNIILRKSTFINTDGGNVRTAVYTDSGSIKAIQSTFKNINGLVLEPAPTVRQKELSEVLVYQPAIIRKSIFINTGQPVRTKGNITVSHSAFYKTGVVNLDRPCKICENRGEITHHMSLIATTFYAPESNVIQRRTTTLKRVNVLEAKSGVFEAKLPDKGTKIFIDMKKDNEEWGSWTSDAVYSVDKPYENYKRLDGLVSESITTPTPTATPIPETVASDTATIPPGDTTTPTSTSSGQATDEPRETLASTEDDESEPVPAVRQDERQEQLIRIGVGIIALLIVLLAVKRWVF